MGNEAVRILLIEDNPADQRLLQYALDAAQCRYELTALRSGEEALACIRKRGKRPATIVPALIVMDLHLPKSDGMETLEAIRNSAGFAETPIVVLSGYATPEEKKRIAELGASYIEKARDLDEALSIGKRIQELALK